MCNQIYLHNYNSGSSLRSLSPISNFLQRLRVFTFDTGPCSAPIIVPKTMFQIATLGGSNGDIDCCPGDGVITKAWSDMS